MRKLTFSQKLASSTALIVIVTIILLVSVNIWKASKSLTELAQTSIQTVTDIIYHDIEAQNRISLDKVESELVLLRKEIDNLGLLYRNKRKKKPITLVDPETGMQSQAEIPTIIIGQKNIDDPSIVDGIYELIGAQTSLLQVHEEKLVFVNTHLKNPDGTRAIGTYIPSSSPVYQAVMGGNTYTGLITIGNKAYIGRYEPFKDVRDRVVAVLFTARAILTRQLESTILNANIGGKGYAYVTDSQGRFIIHQNQSFIGKTLAETGVDASILDARDTFVHYSVDGVATTAYARYFEPWGWHLYVGMADKDMLQGADREIMISSAVAAGIILIVVIFVTLSLLRFLTRPLRELEAYTGKVAAGDYNASIDYTAEDVIGHTVKSVQAMVGEIKNKLGFSEGLTRGIIIPLITVDMDLKVTYLNQQCMDLLELDGTPEEYIGQSFSQVFYRDASRRSLVADAVEKGEMYSNRHVTFTAHKGAERSIITNIGPLHDLDGNVMGGFCMYLDVTEARRKEQQIREQNEEIARIADEATVISNNVSSASEELSAQVAQASQGAQIQSERIQETATAMEEMNATVMEVARNATEAASSADGARDKAQHGAQSVQEVITAINTVHSQAEELKAFMGELNQQSLEIGNIMSVINDIADQTNLLALNAAIEAARAGDAGRGFAVVADEVRKLAEKTMDATKEVGSAISRIQDGAQKGVRVTESASNSVDSSTELAEQSGQALNEIVAFVENTAAQVQAIAAASEQQSATSEEISRAIDDINRISTETSEGTQQSTHAITELARQAQELQLLIEEMKK